MSRLRGSQPKSCDEVGVQDNSFLPAQAHTGSPLIMELIITVNNQDAEVIPTQEEQSP